MYDISYDFFIFIGKLELKSNRIHYFNKNSIKLKKEKQKI